MPIGSQSGLDFFMAQTFFDDQWVLTHADQQGGVGMPLRYNNDKRKKLSIIPFPIAFLIYSTHSNKMIDKNE